MEDFITIKPIDKDTQMIPVILKMISVVPSYGVLTLCIALGTLSLILIVVLRSG